MSDLHSNLTTIKFFWRHAARYPHLLWGMLLIMPLAVLFSRFLPALITAGILDRLARGDFVKDDIVGSFGPELLWAVGLAALGGVFVWRVVAYCNWKMEGLVQRDIYNTAFKHLMKLDANFHANHFAGSLVSQVNKLASAYVRITDTSVFQVGTLLTALTLTSILLVGRAPLFVALLLTFAALYMFCAILITRKVRTLTTAHAESENDQTGMLADSVTNVMAVKSFAAGGLEAKRFGKATEKTRGALVNLMSASLKREFAFTGIGATINGIALVTGVASIVVFDADIATTFLILTYTSNILIQLWDFSTQALRNYNRGFGDAQGMIEIFAVKPAVQDPVKPEKSRIKRGEITFKDMNFTHPEQGQNETLFVGLNLRIKAGEKIGLVGHSGSGKSTLTKLLLRFNDVDGGEIQIDGQNIARITQDDLRRNIAYVPQEPLLFHRTIGENIAYGQSNATEKDIRDAAQKAHASEFIEKLPKGYDTVVGERGVKLSGGQRQRIAIARAILKDAPILVLDEATSALDSESEKLIQAALWELMKNRTAIVIAHRLSTIQKMDRIIVLHDGEILEQGTHGELLNKKGAYAKLWSHQSGGFIEE